MSQIATQNAAPAKVLMDYMQSRKASLAAVAAKGMSPERVLKIVVGAAMRNPVLLKCDPKSVFRSVCQAVEVGLEPGGALGHAHLVPFWNNKIRGYECQLIVDYKGIADLMYRSGLVEWISTEVVYKGDDFTWRQGLNPILEHEPKSDSVDPDDITHVYAVIAIKGGTRAFKVFRRVDIERIRGFSQTGRDGERGPFGPWADHYAEMAKKTVLKNASKLAPKSIEVAKLIAFDNATETGDYSSLDFDIPDALPEPGETTNEPETQVSRTSVRIKKATGSDSEPLIDPTDEPPYEGPGISDDPNGGQD